MSDKIRGALFNALGDIEGLSVLDAFAGSGAAAFEAVSRGAVSALCIDVDVDAHRTITENINKLGLKNTIKALRRNAVSWSRENSASSYDIVILDPPYDDLQPKVLAELVRHVGTDGIIVLSWPGDTQAPTFEDMTIVRQKSYGDAQLVYYNRSNIAGNNPR
jgi:16S rRNA (guanine966-N2)-methyltransferase